MKTLVTEEEVWEALRDVDDPEIPGLSVVDLGIIHSVSVEPDAVRVEVMPTFTGCPAIEMILCGIRDRLSCLAPNVDVGTTFKEAWTTERLTERGREHLRSHGMAPPDDRGGIRLLPSTTCPYCGSRATRLENAFGPTLCRAIYYCSGCRQPFEAFKPV